MLGLPNFITGSRKFARDTEHSNRTCPNPRSRATTMRRRTALVLASMPPMAFGFSIERRGFLSKTAAALGVASIADREANAACK